jgi:hypothetical protein
MISHTQESWRFWQQLDVKLVLLLEDTLDTHSIQSFFELVKNILHDSLENRIEICQDFSGAMFAWKRELTIQRARSSLCGLRIIRNPALNVVVVRPDKHVFGHYSYQDLLKGSDLFLQLYGLSLQGRMIIIYGNYVFRIGAEGAV